MPNLLVLTKRGMDYKIKNNFLDRFPKDKNFVDPSTALMKKIHNL